MLFLRLAVLLAVVIPYFSFAQVNRRDQVRKITDGTMKLAMARPGAQIITAEGKGYKLLDAAAATDKRMVSTSVRLWVGRYSQELFGIGSDAELREYETRRIGNLWQTSFELFYHGIPVRERFVKVNTGALSGAIMLLRSSISAAKPNAAAPIVSPKSIHEAAVLEIAGDEKQVTAIALVYVDNGSQLQLAYEAIAGSPNRERWRLTYDALTGKLIEKKNMLLDRCFEHDGIGELAELPDQDHNASPTSRQHPQAAASGRITAFVHPSTPTDNPVEVGLPYLDITVNGTTTVTDSLGYWSLPTVTYPLTIKTGLKNSYLQVKQDGELVKELTNTILSGTGNVVWDNSNSTESERDALYSLLRARTYIKARQPNLPNIDQLLRTTVDFTATCNAYYDPELPGFVFFAEGGNCNALARVADVVYHEFGHRVNHCYYLNTTAHNILDGSLGEGFADIYSSFMRDDNRIGVGFFTNPTRVLRNIQNNRKWPNDLDIDVHINGLIVAGAFWDLRKATDIETARMLFHTMLELTPDGNGIEDELSLGEAFTNVLVATILADDNDNDLANGTPHLDAIIESFAKHNITLGNLLALGVTPIEDQNVSAESYPISVTASYNAPVGELDEGTVTIYYSTDGSNYAPVSLTKSSGDKFEGSLPKVTAGSIVYYYASAKTTLGDTKESPSPDAPLQFLVGFERKYLDDFESNENWTAKDSSGSGGWERGEPQGTWFPGAENYYVQQDTDHSQTGTYCYITGNMNSSTPSVDDVDNGHTILTSPKLDLSNMRDPFIRYWYYYSNDLGQNPGASSWLVEITSDGTNWAEVVTTKEATDGWQPYMFRLKDLVTPSDAVQIRFRASDYIGSLVEAAVDDFEVLDPAEVNSVALGDAPAFAIEVYPQPVKGSTATVRFALGQQTTLSIALKDILGVEHFRASALSQGDLTLHLPESLSNGFYVLTISTEKESRSVKLLIDR